jgi:uncharacterized membrane protein HdeD (DUF308 family)
MREWKRWQDYATMLYGVLLFISPFVFGETSQPVAAGMVYVLGALLVLAGIVAAANREGRRSVILNAPGVVAVITFFSPWVLVFSGVTGIAWTAWVIAILTVLTAGTIRSGRRAQMRTA